MRSLHHPALLAVLALILVTAACGAAPTATPSPSAAPQGSATAAPLPTAPPGSSGMMGGMPKPQNIPANLDLSTTRVSEQQRFKATISPALSPVPINTMHSWKLHVETAAGQPLEQAQISVNGDMPGHGHGMASTPQVTQNLGKGDYLVEGMKFQMAGWWVVDVQINNSGISDKVSFNLMLK